ncbi:MAG: type 1 glutamine amidotransferase domain-containing protein [Candidatus Thiodiazotropha lotti]|nr:type 1 glutamine amidotransferase domain-containing protein [Candidatus Thiodiazotropha lotti]
MNTIQSILIIVTSFSEIVPGESTGLWLEEFAVPYMAFKSKGYKVSVASIQGGEAPIDPRSNPSPEQQEVWAEAIKALDNTIPVGSVDATEFDAVFIPGGHGTMFDFPDSADLHTILRAFAEQDKVIAAMCHGPASLVGITLKDGTPLVAGKRLTSFTDEEESAAGFTEKMPFLLESRLRHLGAKFVKKPNWSNHVQIDGKLITGQNPQSSKSTALAVIEVLTND